MTQARTAMLRQFAREAGWDASLLRPLAGDASPRRYYRLGPANAPPAHRAVLMDDAAGGAQAVGRFAALAQHLVALGFRAPRVLETDLARGILLLEDLGDDLLAGLLQRAPDREHTCYEAAVDLLAVLRRHPPPRTVHFGGASHRLEPYGIEPLLEEASLLTDWWLPGAGAPTDRNRDADYRRVVTDTVANVAGCREVLVLRDYHAENLLWLRASDSEAWRRIGVLDFQDALRGHPAYDLVSVLEDARRDTSPALREAMHARYALEAGLGASERSEFQAACAALGAQRNLKIIGIFARLCVRDGKPAYLDLIPRVWSHLLQDLAHPSLQALARWVRSHVPEPTAEALAQVRAKRGTG